MLQEQYPWCYTPRRWCGCIISREVRLPHAFNSLAETKNHAQRGYPAEQIHDKQAGEQQVQHHHFHTRGAVELVQILLQLLLPPYLGVPVLPTPKSRLSFHLYLAPGVCPDDIHGKGSFRRYPEVEEGQGSQPQEIRVSSP